MTSYNSFEYDTPGDENTPMLQRKLHRSNGDRWVAGVLGGIAETYNINPTLLRVGFIGSMILPGTQLLLLVYLAAWIVMPAAY